MNKTELLSPAGGPEALTAAVRAGADAVYLGAARFSARGNAHNFDKAALRAAVEYCHARGVRVYLALNTLVRDGELPAALRLAEEACSLPVDALIVQDLGLSALLRKAAPGMPLHASTQMSVHTPAGAYALWEAGFTRVVLARELAKEEIRAIRASCPIELEVFVHGALCMSVSGQCYLSAMLGGRSGNRGLCAQPCRLPFSAPGGTGRDLSLKDYSLVEHLLDLQALGIASAKIEGRMKRPEYVAAATACCRRALDGESIPPELLQNLQSVFSRSGFTDGYYTAQRGRAMFGARSKEDVAAATGAVFSSLRGLTRSERQSVPVRFDLSARIGAPIALRATDPEGRCVTVQGAPPTMAETHEVTPGRCREQLIKTGGTPFFADAVEVRLEAGLAVPASAVNALRREALEKLLVLRAQRPAAPFHTPRWEAPPHQTLSPPRLRARFAHADVPAAFSRCELVYVPLATPPERLQSLVQAGFPVAVEIPRGLFGREEWAASQLQKAKSAGVTHALAHGLGAVKIAFAAGMRVHGGFGLNVMNTAALCRLEELGLEDAELSFELTLGEAARIGGALPRGLLAYGRLPLMLTRNCPAANGRPCSHCDGHAALTDRRGVSFPLQCLAGCTELLNSVPLWMGDRIPRMKNVDFLVLRYSVENSVETEESFRVFNNGDRPPDGFTRGLYDRGVE
jgi:putative protease